MLVTIIPIHIMISVEGGGQNMRKSTVVTQFILEISFLLDKNISFTLQDVYHHIENKDVIDWLEQEFPHGSETGLDFSLFQQTHRDWLHNELEAMFGGYEGSAGRKWGIENNGLCLLVSWSTEIVREIISDEDHNPENSSNWL